MWASFSLPEPQASSDKAPAFYFAAGKSHREPGRYSRPDWLPQQDLRQETFRVTITVSGLGTEFPRGFFHFMSQGNTGVRNTGGWVGLRFSLSLSLLRMTLRRNIQVGGEAPR